jgi:dTMP kinase
MEASKSFLIAVEGIDGSGKSALVRHLERELKENGYDAISVATRELEKEPIFKELLSEYNLESWSPASMFLFQFLHANKADRAKQALQMGKIVIADRWDFSFFVRHDNFDFFSHEPATLRQEVSRLAFKDLKPDLGIYLDIEVDKAIALRQRRGDIIKDIEKEKRTYETIVSSYKMLVKHHGWTTIDANKSLGEIKQTAGEIALRFIKNPP